MIVGAVTARLTASESVVAIHSSRPLLSAVEIVLAGIHLATPSRADYNLRTARTAFGTPGISLFAAYPADNSQDMLRPRQTNSGGGAAALCRVGGSAGRGGSQPERLNALLSRHEGDGRGVSRRLLPDTFRRAQKARKGRAARPRVRGRATPTGGSRNSSRAPAR
jgi:hypothetical protein